MMRVENQKNCFETTDLVTPSNSQIVAEHAAEKKRTAEKKAKTDLPRLDENLSDTNQEYEPVRFSLPDSPSSTINPFCLRVSLLGYMQQK